MCTVTWLDGPAGGYTLLFNRDERRTRLPGRPPALFMRDGVSYLAPIDAEAGGTWLGVNANGVTVGLLNHYAAEAALEVAAHGAPTQGSTKQHSTSQGSTKLDSTVQRSTTKDPSAQDSPSRSTPTSRGHLVSMLMACRSVVEVVERLSADGCPTAYRPYEVLTLDALGDRARATWDGRRLTVARGGAVTAPVSSSGFDTAAVLAVRAATYARCVGGAAEDVRRDTSTHVARLEAFHRSHEPTRGPYSVCMHRQDAQTVSMTWVGVERDAVWMRYGPGPACTAVLGPTLTLGRA